MKSLIGNQVSFKKGKTEIFRYVLNQKRSSKLHQRANTDNKNPLLHAGNKGFVYTNG